MRTISKDVRDMELKEFYGDSVHECFHILEMEHSRDKCGFAGHLVTCLTERAKANCDDYQKSFLF